MPHIFSGLFSKHLTETNQFFKKPFIITIDPVESPQIIKREVTWKEKKLFSRQQCCVFDSNSYLLMARFYLAKKERKENAHLLSAICFDPDLFIE